MSRNLQKQIPAHAKTPKGPPRAADHLDSCRWFAAEKLRLSLGGLSRPGRGIAVPGADQLAVVGAARRPDGVLAGGNSTMLESFRRLVSLGATIAEAAEATSSVAARISRRPELGTLRPGAAADVIVLSDRLELERVVVAGVDAL